MMVKLTTTEDRLRMDDEEKSADLQEFPLDSTQILGDSPQASTRDPTELQDREVSAEKAQDEGSLDSCTPVESSSSQIDSRSSNFPHCAVCGFNVEVFLLHFRRIKPPMNNNWIYRFKCRRKTCNKFFGHWWIKNKNGAIEIHQEDPIFETLPFFSGPDPNIPASEYAKIVKPRVDMLIPAERGEQNGSFSRGSASPNDSRSRSPIRGAPVKIKILPPRPPKREPELVDLPNEQGELSIGFLEEKRDDVEELKPDEPSSVPEQAKVRKGYAYVLETAPPEDTTKKKMPKMPPKRIVKPRPEKSTEFGVSQAPPTTSRPCNDSISRYHRWTQTCDAAHEMSIGIAEVMLTQSHVKQEPVDACSSIDVKPTVSAILDESQSVLSRRLMVASRVVEQARRAEEKLRTERDLLKNGLSRILAEMHLFRRHHIEDTRRIRDDVLASKGELVTYHGELALQAEQIKSIIKEVRLAIDAKMHDLEINNRKIKGQLELTEIKYQQAEAQANRYHRELEERDRKVALVTAEKLEVAKKLEDKLYLTNNQRCSHCTESLNLKNFYEKQAKDKAELVDKFESQSKKLLVELEKCQQSVATLTKKQGKLTFERDTYEADNRRLLAKLAAFKQDDEASNHVNISGGKGDTPNRSYDGAKSASPAVLSPPDSHATHAHTSSHPTPHHQKPSRQPQLPSLPTLSPLSNSDQVSTAFAKWIPKSKPNANHQKSPPLVDVPIKNSNDSSNEEKKRKYEKVQQLNQNHQATKAVPEEASVKAKNKLETLAPPTDVPPVKKPRPDTANLVPGSSTSSNKDKGISLSNDEMNTLNKLSNQSTELKKTPKNAPAPNKGTPRSSYFPNQVKGTPKPPWLQQEARRSIPAPFTNEARNKMGPGMAERRVPLLPPHVPVPPPPGVNGMFGGPPPQDRGLPWHRGGGPSGPNGAPYGPPTGSSWGPMPGANERRGFWE